MVVNGQSSLQKSGLDAEPVRGLGNFAPSLWDDILTSITIDLSEIEAYEPEINALKEELRQILVDPASTALEKVNLIYQVHRLGLSYHFEKEIDSQLGIIFSNLKLEEVKEYDLHTVSVQFRVFRQFGYKMPCDVFEKFMDNTGKFMETLASDVRAMLGLYEASYLRIRGEDILDEALAFSTSHLRNLQSTNLSPLLMKQVAQALKRPFNRGMIRVEAAFYISTYEEEDTRNELLLKLAKLDFNKLQLLYQHELSIVFNWSKDLDLKNKVPHARNRVAEIYVWILGANCVPSHSIGRIANTKLLVILVILDDTFDAYGTIEELELFKDAVNRWDESAPDMLPVDSIDRWRFIYKITLDICRELDELMTTEARLLGAYHAKVSMQIHIQEYYREAFWSATGTTPSYEEYIKNGLITSGVYLMALNIFIGMGEAATKYVYEWHMSRPKILCGSEAIVRLQDDIVTHETEQKRGQFGSAIEYYMKQYSVSKKEAIEVMEEKIENAWKDMNEDCLKPYAAPRDFLMVVFNLASSVDVIYKYNDGFTDAETIKGYIQLLFFTPMVI